MVRVFCAKPIHDGERRRIGGEGDEAKEILRRESEGEGVGLAECRKLCESQNTTFIDIAKYL